MERDRRGDPGNLRPKSHRRYLIHACRVAGYSGDEIDLAEAQDLADELVISGRQLDERGRVVAHGRLRPFVEWAGGEVLERAVLAAAAAENAAAMETMV